MKKRISQIAFIGLFVFISLISCNSPQTKEDKKVSTEVNSLLGTWISEDDPQNEIQITATEWIDIYEKKELSRNKYSVGDTCMNQPNNKPVTELKEKYISVFDKSDIFCYYIVKLESYNLELSYVGRGNTLKFKRKI